MFLCFSASEPPTNLEVTDVKSRTFNISFETPDNVNGVLAAYKIIISKVGNENQCVQQIFIQELGKICPTCMVRILFEVKQNHTF